MENNTEYIQIGKITKTRGIKGEIKVYPYTSSHCLKEYCSLAYVYIGKDENQITKHEVLKARVFRDFFIFLLEGIDTLEKALSFKEQIIFIPKDQQAPLQKDEVFLSDLIGAEVYDKEENFFGKVVHYFETGANGVCEVEKEQKTYLFPTIKSVLLSVDPQKKKIVVDPLSGMFE